MVSSFSFMIVVCCEQHTVADSNDQIKIWKRRMSDGVYVVVVVECVCVSVCVCVCVCVCVWRGAHVYTCLCMCTGACAHLHVFVCIGTCTENTHSLTNFQNNKFLCYSSLQCSINTTHIFFKQMLSYSCRQWTWKAVSWYHLLLSGSIAISFP